MPSALTFVHSMRNLWVNWRYISGVSSVVQSLEMQEWEIYSRFTDVSIRNLPFSASFHWNPASYKEKTKKQQLKSSEKMNFCHRYHFANCNAYEIMKQQADNTHDLDAYEIMLSCETVSFVVNYWHLEKWRLSWWQTENRAISVSGRRIYYLARSSRITIPAIQVKSAVHSARKFR